MRTIPAAKNSKSTMLSGFQRRIDHLPLRSSRLLIHWQRATFWLIMALASFLRLYQFPGTPAGLWIDEITEGYDAYALLQHGTDRWGNPFPFYFPGWGSGQNVLQAYLSIPFIKVFGLNAFSIRIVPLLLGILAVAALYLIVKKIYGTNTALLAAFLLGTLPWHVMVSRWGLESNMFPVFFLLSIGALICCYNAPGRRRWIPLSLIPMAISFYAYGTSIIPIPIFLCLFILFNRKTIMQEKVSFIISIFLFLLVAGPFFLYVLENDVLHQSLGFLAHLPVTIPYLPINRLDEVNGGLSHMDILQANLRFVIGGYEDQLLLNSVPWISPLGWLTPPFAALGIYFSLKRSPLSHNLLVFWLAGMLPTFVLFLFTVHHSNGLYIPLIALSAYGIVSLLEYVVPINTRIVVTTVLLATLFFPNTLFYQYYFTAYNNDNAASFNAGYETALSHALKIAHPNELIYTRNNYAYTLFDLHIDPLDFHTHAHIIYPNHVYRVIYYRRYYFEPSATLNHVTSYIAILKNNATILCQHTEIFFRDITWPNGHWTVERCYPAPLIQHHLHAHILKRHVPALHAPTHLN